MDEVMETGYPTEYVSLDALASWLGLPCSYLRALVQDGMIPYLEPSPGHLRFDVAAVRAALCNLAWGQARHARKVAKAHRRAKA